MDVDQFKKVLKPQVAETRMLVASMSCPGQPPPHPNSGSAPCFLDYVGILQKPSSKYAHFNWCSSSSFSSLSSWIRITAMSVCLFVSKSFSTFAKNYMLIQGKEGKQECRCVGRAGVLLWVAEQI